LIDWLLVDCLLHTKPTFSKSFTLSVADTTIQLQSTSLLFECKYRRCSLL